MINRDLRKYNYYLYTGKNAYGQPEITPEPQGQIEMSIYIARESVESSILYTGAEYIGLTHDKTINDKYVVEFAGERLKVLYAQTRGRFTQVFMARL